MGRVAIAAVLLLLVGSCACVNSIGMHPHHRTSTFGKLGIQGPRRLKQQTYDWEVRWYEQTLDHFTARNATFQQRFLFAPQFWKGPNAPIFFYCGNEGNIEVFAENSGFLWDIAPAFGALVVFGEHRYYGDSMPFGSAAAAYKDLETLTYLSAEQALADYVLLITDLKKNLSAEASPVVLFGGSYGGMLAAWFRLKYPHVATGAIASSAPILHFVDTIPSVYSYFDIVSKDFRNASESCYQTIKNSWDIVGNVTSSGGLRNLSDQFGLCTDLQSSDDLANWMITAYTLAAEADYPVPANFVADLPAYPVKEMCKSMESVGGGSNGLDGIVAAMNVFYNFSGAESCFNLSGGGDPYASWGWGWQQCTEMVMPIAIRENTSMFPPQNWDLGTIESSCLQTGGVMPRPHWTIEEFGGVDIRAVLKRCGSNIVFANGLVDPWSGASVLNDISDSIVASVTNEGAHHADLTTAPTPQDPQWLVQQRQLEVDHIHKWLKEYYSDRHIMTGVLQ